MDTSTRLTIALCLLALSCGDDTAGPAPTGDGTSSTSGGTTSTDPDTTGGSTGGAEGTSSGTDSSGTSGGETEGMGCAHAGFSEIPFDPGGADFVIGEVTPDFTVETLRGEFTLSEHWGDCSMFTLVPIDPAFPAQDVAAMIAGSEPNNTYLFYSGSLDAEADVSALGAQIENVLEQEDPEVYEEWTMRFRYIVTPAGDVPLLAAIAGIQTDYYVIDPSQRLRDAGSYRAFNGDFIPSLPMIQYASRWFGYEHRLERLLEERAADSDVLIVPWVTSGHDQTDEGRLPIELPPAEELARFDRVEIVVKETCTPGSRFPVHYGVCPAWDVGHKISLCDDEATCTGDEHQQLYRYITGYHSGGWWREDVSHGLPWFRQGGTRWMRTNRGDFFGTIDLHFIDDGELATVDHVADAQHLIDMGVGPFDAAHNDYFADYEFTPPPGTERVVLDARVQGGGNQAGNGCAEFCTHEHEVSIGGQTFEHAFVMNQASNDCAERTGEGVTSGQFGTWFFDRGSWCPGGPVERWQEDITAAVDLAGPNTMRWTTFFQGDPWLPGGGMTATVWLVFYGADGQATVQPLPRAACPGAPTVTIRDFPIGHPDFQPIHTQWAALPDGDAQKEGARGQLTGVVAPTLVMTPDGYKPQLVWPQDTLPYTTAANFDDWWRDSAANQTTTAPPEAFARTRQGTAGYFSGNAAMYLQRPLLDPTFGFGDEGVTYSAHGVTQPANAAYTVEMAGSFVHQAGQRLRLGGNDDVFVFVDHQLVLESGGMYKGFDRHVVELDTLGLMPGQTYDFHVFAVGDRGARHAPQLWIEYPGCE